MDRTFPVSVTMPLFESTSIFSPEISVSARNFVLTIDVSAAWQFSPRLQAWLAVDNLTDESYTEFVGNEVRGVLPRAGVRFSF